MKINEKETGNGPSLKKPAFHQILPMEKMSLEDCWSFKKNVPMATTLGLSLLFLIMETALIFQSWGRIPCSQRWSSTGSQGAGQEINRIVVGTFLTGWSNFDWSTDANFNVNDNVVLQHPDVFLRQVPESNFCNLIASCLKAKKN